MNNSALNGGVVYSYANSVFGCKNCLFEGNSADEGGVGYINDEGYIEISNSTFIDNHANEGSVLLIINSDSESTLNLINLKDNQDLDGNDIPAIILQKSRLLISGELKVDNQANIVDSTAGSTLNIQDLNVTDANLNNLISASDTFMTISNVMFDNVLMSDFAFKFITGCFVNVTGLVTDNSQMALIFGNDLQIRLDNFRISNLTLNNAYDLPVVDLI